MFLKIYYLLNAYKGIDRYDSDKGTFTSWFGGIIRNATATYFCNQRTKKHHPEQPLIPISDSHHNIASHDNLEDRLVQQDLIENVLSLATDKAKRIMTLKLSGLTYKASLRID